METETPFRDDTGDEADEEFASLWLESTRLVDEGDFPTARARLEQALRLRPRNGRCRNLLGHVLFKMGQLDPAAALYEELVAENPDAVTLRFNLALVLVKLGDGQRAREQLETVVRLKPDHAKAQTYLGRMYQKQDQLQDAYWAYLRGGHAKGAAEMEAQLRARGVEPELPPESRAPPPAPEPEPPPPPVADVTPPARTPEAAPLSPGHEGSAWDLLGPLPAPEPNPPPLEAVPEPVPDLGASPAWDSLPAPTEPPPDSAVPRRTLPMFPRQERAGTAAPPFTRPRTEPEAAAVPAHLLAPSLPGPLGDLDEDDDAGEEGPFARSRTVVSTSVGGAPDAPVPPVELTSPPPGSGLSRPDTNAGPLTLEQWVSARGLRAPTQPFTAVGPGLLGLPLHGPALVRGRALAAAHGDVRGNSATRAGAGVMGGNGDPLVLCRGEGWLTLDPDEDIISTLRLSAEGTVTVAEQALFGCSAGMHWEAVNLVLEEGSAPLCAVVFHGEGVVALRSPRQVRALPCRPDTPLTVSQAHVLAFAGALQCVPAAGLLGQGGPWLRKVLGFSGEGVVFVRSGTRSEPA